MGYAQHGEIALAPSMAIFALALADYDFVTVIRAGSCPLKHQSCSGTVDSRC